MPSFRYLHLDVFTDSPLEGNQLAVFPEPEGLDTEMMQAITREMNFSECTFIFPPERGGDVKMRIFTPAEELHMAGHPTIGSTFALAAEGTIARGRTDFVFELGVGPTPVSLEWEDGALAFAWMTQQLPKFGGVISDTWSWHWIFFINVPLLLLCTFSAEALLRPIETPVMKPRRLTPWDARVLIGMPFIDR